MPENTKVVNADRITNAEFVNGIKRITNEEILADPKNLTCKCIEDSEGAPFCAYRGKCKECVAIHRYYDGFPHCLRHLVPGLAPQG